MTEDSSDGADTSISANLPWASRGFVISAITVAAIFVVGIAVTITTLATDEGGQGPNAADSSPTTGSTPEGGGVPRDEMPEEGRTTTPKGSDDSASVCGLDGNSDSSFDTFPEDVTWEPVGALEAPHFPGHGPGEVDDNGVRYCYAHSPQGAVAAGLNLIAMSSLSDIRKDVVQRMFAEGEGKEAALEKLKDPSKDEETIRSRLAGVQLVTYNPDYARVDVALQIDDPEAISSHVLDLQWSEGDWRVITRPSGEMVVPNSIVDSLDRYVPTGKAR
ncbi:hypothetical protein FHX37_3766 [Haloactinospora alba]|uniref:DUF8175 domain-containing protein n=1 Tax=Haloactinospora alba TaxID=405555 RepID=A0A543N9C2_9ACTN|nr:hypothetical protein FHX37_3766 [Haloactinospora alba]